MVGQGSEVVPSALAAVRSNPSRSCAARTSDEGAVTIPMTWARTFPGSESTAKARSCFCFIVSDPSGRCGLTAMSRTARSESAGSRSGLVIVQRDIAVGAPGAAVEHHYGGTAARCLPQGCRDAVRADQLHVGQRRPDREGPSRLSQVGERRLLTLEDGHDLVPGLRAMFALRSATCWAMVDVLNVIPLLSWALCEGRDRSCSQPTR